MRRLLAAIVLALAATILTIAFPAAAGAQDDDPPPKFTGVLTDGDTPIPGITIVITEIDGDVSESTVTGDDGSWVIEVPQRSGDYEITIAADELPDDVALTDSDATVVTSSISRPSQERLVLFPLGESTSGGSTTLDQVAQTAVNGLKFGLILALCSIGLSLIFGTTGLINFAHSELVTFGAALAWWFNTRSIESTLIVAALLAFIGSGLLGAALEKGIMRPLRARKLGSFQFVVVTIGLSLIGRQVIQMWIGEGNLTYRQYQIQKPWELGPVSATPRDVTLIVLSALILVGVASVLQFTRMGKAMRAVSDNADLAASSGIPVNRVILAVWMGGAGLAGIGGVFLGLSEVIKFDMGFRLLPLIFAAVILGGLGTAYGAMVGGVLIGVVTEVSTVWVEPELKSVWALLVMIIVLIVRPQGILGVKERVG